MSGFNQQLIWKGCRIRASRKVAFSSHSFRPEVLWTLNGRLHLHHGVKIALGGSFYQEFNYFWRPMAIWEPRNTVAVSSAIYLWIV